MNDLNYKCLSYISIMFFISNFILSLCNAGYLNGLCFVIFILCILLLDKFKHMMIALRVVIMLSMFLPVFLIQNVQGKIVSILIALITLAIIRINDEVSSIDRKMFFIESAILLVFIMFFIGCMLSGISYANKYMVPYAILYVVFSFLYMRQMRSREFNIIRQSTIKINIIYLGILIFMTATLSISLVRSFVIKIFERLILFFGLSLYSLLQKIYTFIYSSLLKFSTSSKVNNQKVFKPKSNKIKFTPDNKIINMNVYYIIGIVVVSIILIIIVTKVLKLQYKKETKSTDFFEKKQYVKVQYNKKKISKIYSSFIKGSFEQRIRYYYYKLMKECVRKNININNCDTTDEINRKAMALFNEDKLKKIRKIYVKARYTDKKCTKEDFEEFYIDYKERTSN